MSVVTNKTILKLNPNNVTRKYLKGTIIEPGLTLNEVATDFYELIDGNKKIEDLIKEIASRYDVSEDLCAEDLSSLTKQLLEKGVVFIHE